MATRLYFPVDEAAAVSPDFAVQWDHTSEALRRRLSQTQGLSAITVGSRIGPWGLLVSLQALDRQYVSDPIAAQTLSGTCKLQLMVREYDNSNEVDRIALRAFVVSNDGLTVRSPHLLSIGSYGPAGEFINDSTHRNKIGADGDAVGSVVCSVGDRIVVEIGYANTALATISSEASAKWGENATDLPESETQTTDGAGWFELSGDVEFLVDFLATPDPVAVPIVIPSISLGVGTATLDPDPVTIAVGAPVMALQLGDVTISPTPLAIPHAVPEIGVDLGVTLVVPDAPEVVPFGAPPISLLFGTVTTPADPIAVVFETLPITVGVSGTATLTPDPIETPCDVPPISLLFGEITSFITSGELEIQVSVPEVSWAMGTATLAPSAVAVPLVVSAPPAGEDGDGLTSFGEAVLSMSTGPVAAFVLRIPEISIGGGVQSIRTPSPVPIAIKIKAIALKLTGEPSGEMTTLRNMTGRLLFLSWMPRHADASRGTFGRWLDPVGQVNFPGNLLRLLSSLPDHLRNALRDVNAGRVSLNFRGRHTVEYAIEALSVTQPRQSFSTVVFVPADEEEPIIN